VVAFDRARPLFGPSAIRRTPARPPRHLDRSAALAAEPDGGQFWSLAAMQKMMRIHLNQVIALAVDQIKGHYGAAIKLYDKYIHHILVGMADMLSNGIIQQFPNRFD
jgi:hypothetical protein